MAMNTATVTSSLYNVILSSRLLAFSRMVLMSAAQMASSSHWATFSSIAHIVAVLFTLS